MINTRIKPTRITHILGSN